MGTRECINVGKKPGFKLAMRLDRIQDLRFAAALMESGYAVCIPGAHAQTFRHMQKFLDISFHAECAGVPTLPEVLVDHKTPECRLGHLSRPLIFPRSMLKYLRSRWQPNRSIRLSFCGLLTESRKCIIGKWMGKTSGEPSFGNQGVLGRALRRLSTLIWGRHVWQDKSLGILIASSNRGRQFPTKAWDQGYFDLLCDSQFVLCPDGDFQWTYRFFEAVICGAIPVVQSESAIYHGYAYRVMNKAN